MSPKAKPFLMRLTIEGIAALVPSSKLDFSSPKKNLAQLEVFFPLLRSPHDAGIDLKRGLLRHPHFFWIELESHRLGKSSRQPDVLYRPTRGEKERSAFVVSEKESFKLSVKSSPPKLVANQGIPGNQKTPTGLSSQDRQSLWWIPRPEDLTGEKKHGQFDQSDPDGLLCKLTLDRGLVFTGGFSGDEDPWSFFSYRKTADSGPIIANPVLGRAIGSSVVVEMEVTEVKLEGDKKTVLHIAPPSGPGEVVSLSFKNMESEAILGQEVVATTGPDPDFGEYYRFSVGESVSPWVLPEVDGSSGTTRKPCAPALFSS